MTRQLVSDREWHWRLGHVMVQFCGYLLVGSAVVKLLRLSGPVMYMASMGFENGTLLVVAIIELITAVLFLLPKTRMLGLLLVSSYLGGAIASHLAIRRPYFHDRSFIEYMAQHRYTGAVVPFFFLVIAWAGMWLAYPVLRANPSRGVDHSGEHSSQENRRVVLGSAQ